ncbi:HMCN [Mytilus coruscus]|uniref:HMCN n=1 Tax=Mytilus coruscus TaxID=42192 RepID=A0A6J7ZXU4_MYTCO|nr:HMCN [Mytilus coruscus]
MDLYATEGEITILQCQSNVIDHWENLNNKSFFAYCNEKKSPSRHFLIEECNLQIRVTVDDYSTTYRCVIGGNPPRFKDFKICMPIPPTSMNVVEAESGKHVVGVEGHQMTLTCNVNSGKPMETIFWTKNGIVVLSGGPGRLLYTFIPKREDNFQNYTCTANNTLKSIALRENIQLRLSLRPSILVNMTTICMEENMTVILNCLETSGQKVKSYHWVYNEAGLIETSNELFLTPLNKSIDGSYTCTGKNEAGSDNATLVLQEDELCQKRNFPSIHLHSDGTNIYVSWKRGFVFVIEYRQHNSEMWRMISYHDTKKLVRKSLQISDLRPSTEYIIRLSVNGSNGHTVSKEYKMKTKGMNLKAIETTTTYIVLIVVFTAGIVFGTVFLVRQLLKNRQQENNEEVPQQEEDMDGIAAENQIYQSMSDLLAQPGASGHNADFDSSFERSGVSYTNHEVSYDLNVNTTTIENKNRESNGSFNRNKIEASDLDRKISKQLKYIEVFFDPFPKSHTFVIRGAQHRTPYALIDFDAHVDPLSSSSESEDV